MATAPNPGMVLRTTPASSWALVFSLPVPWCELLPCCPCSRMQMPIARSVLRTYSQNGTDRETVHTTVRNFTFLLQRLFWAPPGENKSLPFRFQVSISLSQVRGQFPGKQERIVGIVMLKSSSYYSSAWSSTFAISGIEEFRQWRVSHVAKCHVRNHRHCTPRVRNWENLQSHFPPGDDVRVKSSDKFATATEVLVARATMLVAFATTLVAVPSPASRFNLWRVPVSCEKFHRMRRPQASPHIASSWRLSWSRCAPSRSPALPWPPEFWSSLSAAVQVQPAAGHAGLKKTTLQGRVSLVPRRHLALHVVAPKIKFRNDWQLSTGTRPLV